MKNDISFIQVVMFIMAVGLLITVICNGKAQDKKINEWVERMKQEQTKISMKGLLY